jgi:outer membrane murein-binding lipoprotein Lpp
MEIMMTKGLRWFSRGALVGAAIAVAGCASPLPLPPAGLEQKIEHAISRTDHEDLAGQYERQAAVDSAAATRHKGYAAIYRRNRSPRSSPEAHVALARHCESIAQAYEQAANEHAALAKLHRELAREAK